MTEGSNAGIIKVCWLQEMGSREMHGRACRCFVVLGEVHGTPATEGSNAGIIKVCILWGKVATRGERACCACRMGVLVCR